MEVNATGSQTLYEKFMQWQANAANNFNLVFEFSIENETENPLAAHYQLGEEEMQIYDVDGDQAITLEEYTNGQTSELGYCDDEIKEAIASDFYLFDYDGNGNLSQAELAFVHYLADCMTPGLNSYNAWDYFKATDILEKAQSRLVYKNYVDDTWQHFLEFGQEMHYKNLAAQDAQIYIPEGKTTVTRLEYAQQKLENQTFNSEEEKLNAVKHAFGIAAILDSLSAEETDNTIDENSFVRYYRNFDILDDGSQNNEINLDNSENFENMLISAIFGEDFWNNKNVQAEIEVLLSQLQ